MIFPLQILRLRFEARQPMEFPEGKAGNILRGALGTELDRGIFRPRQDSGPSGLADPPRPFVLRPRNLDGRKFRRSESFDVQVNLFDPNIAAPIAEAFSQALRGRAALQDANREDVAVDLSPSTDIEALLVRFVTPTELKTGDGLARTPDFGVLLARARDRVSTLAAMYAQPLEDVEYRLLGERAQRIETVRANLAHHKLDRRSSRTEQVHPLGGFTGEAEYRGALAEFEPWLRAASYTGVGRQTVWGKGEIEVQRVEKAPIA